MADFDDDPFPEVILVANGNVFLFEHSGEIQWGPVVPSINSIMRFRTTPRPSRSDTGDREMQTHDS